MENILRRISVWIRTNISGADQSTRQNSPPQTHGYEERASEHREHNSSSGCFMCFAPQKPTWAFHVPEQCWHKVKIGRIQARLQALF
jgi:hypothetical protein